MSARATVLCVLLVAASIQLVRVLHASYLPCLWNPTLGITFLNPEAPFWTELLSLIPLTLWMAFYAKSNPGDCLSSKPVT